MSGYIYFLAVRQPQWARISSICMLHDHTRWNSSGRVISPSQKPLPDNTQHSQQTDIHAAGWIRTHNPIKLPSADPRLRPCCNWERLVKCMYVCMYVCIYVCMYVRRYVCMYVCMYVCVYVRVYVRMQLKTAILLDNYYNPSHHILIHSKPLESQHSDNLLTLFKLSSPKLMWNHQFQYPSISKTTRHAVRHTKHVRPPHTSLRIVFGTSLQRSSSNQGRTAISLHFSHICIKTYT